jgi:hypothetical protein
MKTLRFVLGIILLGASCKSPSGSDAKDSSKPAVTYSNDGVYVQCALPDPEPPTAGNQFSLTICVMNQGKIKSSTFDMMIWYEDPDIPNTTVGLRHFQLQSINPGETTKVATGGDWVVPKGRDYVFVISLNPPDGKEIPMRWTIRSVPRK